LVAESRFSRARKENTSGWDDKILKGSGIAWNKLLARFKTRIGVGKSAIKRVDRKRRPSRVWTFAGKNLD